MEGLTNYTFDKRPWGQFEQFTHNEQTTVKIITVSPHEAFSLQRHSKRSEFWKFVSGNGIVTVGDTKQTIQAGLHVFIPAQTVHRVEAGTEAAVFLEVAFGDFDENDIVRLEDKYDRARVPAA